MENKAPRKTDRRTIYTQNVIKESLLELLSEKTFDKLTVSQLCNQADLTRTTFYVHYNNLTDVLDSVIEDALEIATTTDSNKDATFFPACQRIADMPKYRSLFMDETLSGYIVKKMFQYEKNILMPQLINDSHLSKTEAELLFRFLLNGSFSVNKALGWDKNDTWYDFQNLLLKFIRGGLKNI